MNKKKVKLKKFIPFYIMAAPAVLYMIINNYLPMFGIVIAFKNLDFRKGILGSDWAGFDNFKYLFVTKDAFIMTRNTILYNLAFIILGIIFGLTVAILLNEITKKFILSAYQSLMLVPYLMSWVVVNYLVYAFLASDTGLINNSIIEKLGMESISWYSTPKYWPFILVIINLWKGIGFSMIVYYSSIVGISTDYFEAARIDGATKWQQIKNITLPLLKPTVITLLILSIGRMFYSDFGLFYQIPRNSGMLYNVTRTIDTYVYNALMNNADYAMSSAASVYQSIVGFVLIILANTVIKKISSEDALF
ncbi:MAG TPA: sugar ABC transporter permease [Clostridiales bacterium]|nr:sugar ABC transporter permease [Clostridiales bacterium]